eukprot:g45849.t1
MHRGLRTKVLNQLVGLAAPLDKAALLVQGGSIQNQYYSDTELYFRQESNFLYLCGFQLPPYMGPSLIMVLPNTTEGYAVLFVGRPSLSYSIWNGFPEPLDQLQTRYGVDAVMYTDEFPALLPTLQLQLLHVIDNSTFTPSTKAAIAAQAGLSVSNKWLMKALSAARAVKTEHELQLMRIAAQESVQAHKVLMALAARKQLKYEYQAAAAFKQTTASCGGWSHQAYLPIVGAGPNSAVLHYVTAYEPIQPHDMLLVDAGAEFLGYTTDITRTYPVDGRFSPLQKIHYQLVLDTHDAVRDRFVEGALYSDIATLAAKALISALLEQGLAFNGTQDQLWASRIDRVFMPHGLGHPLGLDVHDPRDEGPLNLTAGMVWTCEPGVYFIPDLIASALKNENQSRYLNEPRIQQFMDAPGVGGVRIEDVLLVRAGGQPPELLSAGLPTTVEEIEDYFWVINPEL